MELTYSNLTRFRQAREMAGLSPEQAAKYLGFSLNELLEIESGAVEVNEEEAQKLALFYEVDFQWLKSSSADTDIAFLGDLQIAPRELEKIKAEELPKLLQILVAIRNKAKDK